MSIFVFLGPTLSHDEARRALDAVYLPPVACGDVEHLIALRPKAIGIVDGYFTHKPAVFHKEILHALAAGIPVLGASSMGALRAAELHPFGMVGVGEVFEGYRSGAIVDDDEVTVVHGDASSGFAPYSDAMVNLRDGFARAVAEGALDAAQVPRLVALAKATFYAERSWRRLLADARAEGVDTGSLEQFVERVRPNRKRDDAILLLHRIADEPAPSLEGFPATVWWRRLRARVTHAGRYGDVASSEIPASAYALHVRLHGEREVAREAAMLAAVDELADARGLAPLPADPEAALAASDARLDLLAAAADRARVDGHLSLALLRRGELDRTISAVRRKWVWLAARGLTRPSLRDAGLDLDSLMRWYRDNTGAREPTVAAAAAAIKVDVDDFVEEVLREYLFREWSVRDAAPVSPEDANDWGSARSGGRRGTDDRSTTPRSEVEP